MIRLTLAALLTAAGALPFAPPPLSGPPCPLTTSPQPLTPAAPAALTDPMAGIEIEWASSDAPAVWSNSSSGLDDYGVEFFFARLSGTPQQAGVWARLMYRMRVDPSFATADVPGIYKDSRLWTDSDFDFNSTYPPTGSTYPVSLHSQATLKTIVPAIGQQGTIPDTCQPLMTPPSGQSTAARIWDADYQWMDSATQSYWQQASTDTNEELFNPLLLVAHSVTGLTAGAVNGADWIFYAGRQAMSHNLRLELQVIYFYDPSFPYDPYGPEPFPLEGTDEGPNGVVPATPAPPTGNFVSVGTTSRLTYSFGIAGPAHPPYGFNSSGPPATQFTGVTPGIPYLFKTSGLFAEARARLQVVPASGTPYTMTVPLTPAAEPGVMFFIVPNLHPGDEAYIKRLKSNGVWLEPIPLAYQSGFYML